MNCQLLRALLAALAILSFDSSEGQIQTQPEAIPTGQKISPTAAMGAVFQDLNPGYANAPNVRADRAAAVAVSPDGKWLAILTSGWNRHYNSENSSAYDPTLSTELVFLFDITGAKPRQVQVLQVPNTFAGLAWSPSSSALFVSGGVDDVVYEFVRADNRFISGRTFQLRHRPIFVFATTPERAVAPLAGPLACSPDGSRLLVANLNNDSVSLLDLSHGKVIREQDLRPGKIDPTLRGRPGGSYPRGIVWISATRAYVGSERDREIISLKVSADRIEVIHRTPVHGQPIALISNRSGSRVYAALENTDDVAVLDTTDDKILEEFTALAPESEYLNPEKLGGANSNGLALTHDGRILLVTNGGQNSVAVVRLSDRAIGSPTELQKSDRARAKDDDEERERHLQDREAKSAVVGLVPTGWYPTGVALSKEGGSWFIVNGKSPTGPNANGCPAEWFSVGRCRDGWSRDKDWVTEPTYFHDKAVVQLQHAGFLTIPSPTDVELARLTKQVAHNNGFDRPDKTAKDEALFASLRQRINHVIYIIKENRSYDQILGDLEVGNGEPRLAIFPESITPNQHSIARHFVTLDNFLVSGEGSWTGWQWSTAGRTNDIAERTDMMNLAGRGSINRGLNLGYATQAQRHAEFRPAPEDPDLLPGYSDVAELDGPGGEVGKGYIWDAALRSGKTVRNYGFSDLFEFKSFTNPPGSLTRDPFAAHEQVFFPKSSQLMPLSDLYFRGWDNAFPDFWRYKEWRREFEEFSKLGHLPDLMLVRLGGDHTGLFNKAVDGVDTPETQVADNDYAVGLLVDAVAHSAFAGSTLIVVVEDDTWNGFDHADAFRAPVWIVGPYVRQKVVVSRRYTTVNVIKTIEELLGFGPIGLNDALAAPMSDVFDLSVSSWSYDAVVPDVLRSTKLPVPSSGRGYTMLPKHSAAYWTKAMADQDFSGPDRVNPMFSRELWRGLKGDSPYPVMPDLEVNHVN